MAYKKDRSGEIVPVTRFTAFSVCVTARTTSIA